MIDEKLTIGLELEGLRSSPRAAELIAQHNFTRHQDASVRDSNDRRGFELVTGILEVSIVSDDEGKNLSIDFGNTYTVLEALCESISEVNTTCGFHVHFGRPDKSRANKSKWKPEQVRTWLTIGALLEEKLYDLVPASRKNNPHCYPIAQRYSSSDLQSFYPTGAVAPRKDDNPKRYCWLNIIETRRVGNNPRPGYMASEATGTVEIRLLGNTRRADYAWAWVQMWTRIAAYIAYLPTTFAMMHCVVTGSISSDWERVKSKKSGSEDNANSIRNAPTTVDNTLRTVEANPILRPIAPTSPTSLAPTPRRRRTRPQSAEQLADEIRQPRVQQEVARRVAQTNANDTPSPDRLTRETRDGLQRALNHARQNNDQGSISTLERQMQRLLAAEQEETPVARRRRLRRLNVEGTRTGRITSRSPNVQELPEQPVQADTPEGTTHTSSLDDVVAMDFESTRETN